MALPVIRPSSLSSYPDCPRRCAARLFRPVIEAAGFSLRMCYRNIASSIGTATHSAAAHYLRDRQSAIQHGDVGVAEIPLSNAIDVGVDALGSEIEHGVVWDDTSRNLDTAQKQVIRQAKSYIEHTGSSLYPIMVEERLEAQVGPFILSGQADVMTDGVRDLKTGIVQRNNAPQLGAYSMLMRSHGYHCSGTIEDFVKRVPLSRDQPPPVSIEYDHALAENTAKMIIGRIVKDYEAFTATGDPEVILANPMSMLCGEKWCDAWGSTFCKHGRKK